MKDWTLYEINNPSDALSMYAPDPVTGGVAVALLGEGGYGIEGTPILFGWDAWIDANCGGDIPTWLRQGENKANVAKCLASVALGSLAGRKDYDAALEAITDEVKRADFIAQRNDRLRSSMNNIEARAHDMAKRLSAYVHGAEP